MSENPHQNAVTTPLGMPRRGKWQARAEAAEARAAELAKILAGILSDVNTYRPDIDTAVINHWNRHEGLAREKLSALEDKP